MTEYQDIDALNWSSLKLMADSALHYHRGIKHPRKDTAALALGRKVHMAVLEPERFERDCVRRPDEWDSWRTKASKEWRQEQLDAGREVLDEGEAETIERMRESIANHADAKRRLEGTRREESIVWTVDGVACKGRVDAIAADRVVDLKTCRDLGLFVRRDAASLLYHGQLAWYLDGAIAAGACSPDAKAYTVPVENCEPFDCTSFELGPVSLEAGRRLWRRLFDQWVTCRDTGLWPGRYPNESVLELADWAAGMQPDADDNEEF
jgi:hypothetical protein